MRSSPIRPWVASWSPGWLLVGEGLGGLLPVVDGDQGDALAGVGPVAELQLGGVPSGQGDGAVTEDLHALLG